MKLKLIIIFIFILNVTIVSADDFNIKKITKLNKINSNEVNSFSRWYTGGNIGATFGDFTQISIAPLIGYRISPEVSSGLQFIYNHSWQKINEGQSNQTTLQSNTYGGNIFIQYNPIKEFYLKGEFEYDSYSNFTTTQNTRITQAVPFLFLGMGYSKAISKSASFNAGIKFDVLNDINSPYQDFTPFIYAGIGVGI